MIEKNRPTLSGKAIATNSILTTPAGGFKGNPSFVNLSPLKAIRAFCLDCACSSAEVSACTRDGKVSSLCPLYRFRFGHNPARSGIGNHNAFFGGSDELNKGFDDSSAFSGAQIPSETSNSSEGR